MEENQKKDLDTGDGFFDDAQNTPNGDGFFDDAPKQDGAHFEKREGAYSVERAPAPAHSNGNKKSIGKIFLSIGLALVLFFGGMLTTWFCLDKELRTIIKIKRTIDREYYQGISDSDFYGVLFSAINDDLLDAHSEYMTDEQYRASEQDLSGKRSGIGVAFSTLTASGEPQIMIYRVVENSPAEVAGLKFGDQILAFGKSQMEMTESVDYKNVFEPFLDGLAESEPFYLQVQRGGTLFTVEISKEYYVESYVSYRTNKTSYGFVGKNALDYIEKGKALSVLPDDTAYIKLSQFTGNAAKALDRVMTQFKTDGMKNLVLDLRGNGGGYVDYMQYMAKYFCKNATAANPILMVADYGEKKEAYAIAGNVYKEYFAEDSRVVVLADQGTASASEALLGCMLDYGTVAYQDLCLFSRNGVAKTYGKGIMQQTFYLDAMKKDYLKLTVAELHWPISGKSIHGRGILPEDGVTTMAENIDREIELENAIKTLFP